VRTRIHRLALAAPVTLWVTGGAASALAAAAALLLTLVAQPIRWWPGRRFLAADGLNILAIGGVPVGGEVGLKAGLSSKWTFRNVCGATWVVRAGLGMLRA
jgi:hypothetical protein